ncbi:CCA tRNA nucleotidyltransferase [Bacillus pinisoli]|uniref:CCA tRNA nucleotidyltransferase n=1 Tax=Bacillus pinisoli TaxID=2901866 RepID=UPI001FF3E8FE
MKEVFEKPYKIVRRLTEKGYQAYFVGGAIRDTIMNRPIGDIDISTSALPEQVMELFPKTIPVGIEHGTVVVMLEEEAFEVTTFRKDDEYLDHRRPTNVQFIDSLLEDLKRRDFTMNAIAMNEHGQIFDPFHGQAAIKEKKIQTVGVPHERFQEDALRMVRAIRFHSQLAFDIEQETLLAIKANANLLHHISIERISVELEKTLSGINCKSAMQLLAETGLSEQILSLISYRDQLQHWPNIHSNLLKTRTEKWALLCTVLKVKETEWFLKTWKLPTRLIKEATSMVLGLEEIQATGWTNLLMYKLGEELTISTERLRLIQLGQLDETEVSKRFDAYKKLPIYDKSDLAVNGHELIEMVGQPPGPWVSKVLSKMEHDILVGKLDNQKELIKEWLNTCNQL